MSYGICLRSDLLFEGLIIPSLSPSLHTLSPASCRFPGRRIRLRLSERDLSVDARRVCTSKQASDRLFLYKPRTISPFSMYFSGYVQQIPVLQGSLCTNPDKNKK